MRVSSPQFMGLCFQLSDISSWRVNSEADDDDNDDRAERKRFLGGPVNSVRFIYNQSLVKFFDSLIATSTFDFFNTFYWH